MNVNGSIIVPALQSIITASASGVAKLILTLTIDPTELQYQGAATFTLSQTRSNTTWTLATLNLIAGQTTPITITQICFCNVADTVNVAFNFASNYTCPSKMKCINTTFTVQDISVQTNPIFMIGNLNASPSFVNASPLFLVMSSVLSNANGKVTFNLTTNGLSNGPTLFPNGIGIASFNSKAPSSLSNSVNQPLAFEDSRAPDNSSITANVLVNAVSGVLLGGTVNGLTVAPTGTIVQLLILGW